jgi:hypothetical protein
MYRQSSKNDYCVKVAQPNQSLPPRNDGSRKKRLTSHAERDGEKRSLTEVAVDDFARAKQTVTIGLDIPRAQWLPSLRRFAAAA